MQNGGSRPGAGRPKGGANKINDEARKAALEGGISPLEYLLSVLRDEDEQRNVRIDAAKAAAPYIHARLSNVDMNAKVDAKAAVNILTGVPRCED